MNHAGFWYGLDMKIKIQSVRKWGWDRIQNRINKLH